MRHAFTVDLEDWYHGIPLDALTRAGAERRLSIGTDRLLELLERHRVSATFFVLGPIAREHPDLLRRIVSLGHDVGSHGTSHDLLYTMTPERFRRETRDSIQAIEEIVAQPVDSYRAAYFSLTRDSLWALEILAELGIRYDSSIMPAHNWRYGIPEFSRLPVRLETAHGPIEEFPISVREIAGRTVPAAGGAYFRLYPWMLTRSNLKAAERAGQPVIFYIHPWELDPDHPRVPFHWKSRMTHYAALDRTLPRLEKMLAEFSFTTLKGAFGHAIPRPGS
ncbi:MAG: polysaccharide deacetylase family protein [Candidatus Eisenbacteria bacterium]|nr:polysaccharide deacetylase family protein [Candidatus Eisenbacteria bacterium]